MHAKENLRNAISRWHSLHFDGSYKRTFQETLSEREVLDMILSLAAQYQYKVTVYNQRGEYVVSNG